MPFEFVRPNKVYLDIKECFVGFQASVPGAINGEPGQEDDEARFRVREVLDVE